MSKLLQDVRYAMRTMLKRPGFTVIAIVTLALGIGSSTAIFTVVDAAVLRGLPYTSPDRLYHLWESRPQAEFGQREFSYPDYQDYQQNNVCDLAAYTGGGSILNWNGESERVFAPAVSANFFAVLGVNPFRGRTFQPGEDKQGGPKVAVLTFALWQRRFGGDEGILGKQLNLSGDSYTVIGVLPATFQFALRQADLFLPYQPTQNQLTRRFMHGTNLIARLKSGVSEAQAQAELGVIGRHIEQQYNESHAGTALKMVPLQEQIVGQVKPILKVLLGAVGFVLLIACANVASLLLTRSLARQKEVGIRTALGASRWRVVRQLLTESAMLSFAGGLVGLLIAYWGTAGLVAMLPANQIAALPFLTDLQIDLRILGFSFALSIFTGVIFGLAPAIQSSRLDLSGILK
ncbi:MAG TPA: ABC transporter permease, partial [Pyrinomonadaceae bacterium]|nr:ABC transporter permease [Pyrinomonadaceae bacterium]